MGNSSMTLATIEWLIENGVDYSVLMDKFKDWYVNGAYTPYQHTFDCGNTVADAICNYVEGTALLKCGSTSEWGNGNGSLMRILPVALWCKDELSEMNQKGIDFIEKLSSLTHATLRCKMACVIYSKIIVDLLHTKLDKQTSIQQSLDACKAYYESNKKELKIYHRLQVSLS